MDVIQLTDFGGLFMLTALLLLGWRRSWLPGLLPVAAVLQAPAVVTFELVSGRFGITPFNVASAFVGVALVLRLWETRRISPPSGSQLRIYAWWSLFLACSALGALILPRLFEHVPVHPLIALSDIDPTPVPNRWSLSHLAQAINSLALWVLFSYVLIEPDRVRTLRVLFIGLIVALALSLMVGLYQRAAMFGLIELHAAFWGSNPGYNQFFLTPEYGPSIGRVGLPFPEPSYASVWFAAAIAGTSTALLYADHAHRRLLTVCGIAAFAGLANTVGTSGLAACLAFFVFLFAFHALWGRRERQGGLGIFFKGAALSGAIVVLLIVDRFWIQLDSLRPLHGAIDWTVQKFEAYLSGVRLMSNLRAIEVAIQTYGLGAGAGSTRASSYLLSLLANTGLPGTMLFLSALFSQLRATYRCRHSSPEFGWALLGATVCVLIGVSGGISDQNWPVLWVLLLSTFAFTGFARTPPSEASASSRPQASM